MLNTYTSYQLIARDMTKSLERVGQEPLVERDVKYYLENIKEVKTAEEFLADDRLFRFAMKAFGLEDMSYAKAFMAKAIKEGIDSEDAFANKLADRRYYDFVETFNFARYGDTTTIFGRTQQGTVDKYVRQTLEENAGNQNEGVRLALYFERKAAKITNWYQVLADPAMAQVVRTSLGLPDSFATADIDRQVKLFEEKIDIEDFADPEKLSEFMTKFTSLWEVNNPTQTPQAQVSVLFGQPAEFGVSVDLLLTMQNMKF